MYLWRYIQLRSATPVDSGGYNAPLTLEQKDELRNALGEELATYAFVRHASSAERPGVDLNLDRKYVEA